MVSNSQNEEKSKAEEIIKEEEKSQKSAILQVLKCYKKTGLSQDLDVRKMVITPNGKYLITCSEIEEGEEPKVCVWSVEKILQKVKNEEFILEGILKAEKIEKRDNKLANWLLCVDAISTKINEKDIWIVCAGSINGDIYFWSGDIDKKSGEWITKPSFFKNFSENMENSRAIFDMKIWEDKKNKTYNIYLISNNLGVISKDKTGDNYIKEVRLSTSLDQNKINFEKIYNRKFTPIQDEWILSFDIAIMKSCINCDNILIPKNDKLYCKECKKELELDKVDDYKLVKTLITGSNDNTISKWDLETGTMIEPEIGSHENGITCIKIFENGNKLASGCLDSNIKIWDLKNRKFLFDIPGHTKEIVSIDIQEDNEYLISASRDNTIKIWDLEIKVLVRDINTDYDQSPAGLDFLRQVFFSPKDQYIFAIKKNRILILENYGRLWHFNQQLKFIEMNNKKLYKSIYGENLEQLVKNKKENEESLREIYKEIKKRLTNDSGRYNPWKLGDLFIPSFVKFEDDDETQKVYIESVRTSYESYWESAKKMFHEIPDLAWEFKLFLTTDAEEKIEDTKFVEITNSNQNENVSIINSDKKEKIEENIPYIILRDRKQSQVRFLMVLVKVPTTFIPLLKAITLDVEDDRGDKDKLIFSDFKRSRKNFVNILKDTTKSTEEYEKYTDVNDNFYYSYCTFKLDERYSTEKSAEIFFRKKSIEFTESLNPLESKKFNDEDFYLFEVFRNNFLSPITPNTHIQIGKGLGSKVGKIMDNYLAGLIMLDFIFTVISILILYKDVFEQDYLISPFGMILFSLNVLVSALIIIFAFTTTFKKKERRVIEKRKSKLRKIIKV